MDNWIFFKEVDFADETILQYHIDTRDFHCAVSKEKNEKIDISKLQKYPERFFYSPDETKILLTRLFDESGGNGTWRMLTLEGLGAAYSENWLLKYIRIYRTNKGLIFCNSHQYALKKEILSCPVNVKHTHLNF